jgi:hypothetical protein
MIPIYAKLWTDEKLEKEASIGLYFILFGLAGFSFLWPIKILAGELIFIGLYLLFFKGILKKELHLNANPFPIAISSLIGIILIFIGVTIFS